MWSKNLKFPLILRRPSRHSWRIGLFFGCHGSALTAFPKEWKNSPHKSSIKDFFKNSIFCCDSTYYGVLLYLDFGSGLNRVKLFTNIFSFETQFFILSTIKNTGQVFRVIWPHPHLFRQIWRNGHVSPYKVRAPESGSLNFPYAFCP